MSLDNRKIIYGTVAHLEWITPSYPQDSFYFTFLAFSFIFLPPINLFV